MDKDDYVWVATWYPICCWWPVVDQFETKQMALDWVGDRQLISLERVDKGERDGEEHK